MIKRLTYIDVAKGILILLVIFDHLPDVYLYVLGNKNDFLEFLNDTQWIYKLFFMPAFFVITGMCSNFNKPFASFFISNFKTLIIPNFLIGVLLPPTRILSKVIEGVFYGGGFWFLSALFVSKMIYWLLNKYCDSKKVLRLTILMILAALGLFLNLMPQKYDLWYFHYAFSLSVFLEIGKIIKANWKDSHAIVASLIYVMACIYLSISDIHKPVVALGATAQITELPIYLLLAICGTYLILGVSKYIDANSLLQFFGRESLVFYIFQIYVLIKIESFYLHFFEVSSRKEVLLFIFTVFFLAIFVLSLISFILNKRYFCILKGKF